VAIAISELVDRAELGVHVVRQDRLARTVTGAADPEAGPRAHRLARAAHGGRVLVLGGTEIDYLEDHESARTPGIATLFASDPCVSSCVAAASSRRPSRRGGRQRGGRVVGPDSTADSSRLVTRGWAIGSRRRRRRTGVLMDVLGIGVLMIGKSAASARARPHSTSSCAVTASSPTT
jgi:hypothetical protein